MTVKDIFQSISERIQSTASVKVVYGDPVTAEGKTIIPVARVRYGFGAGGGEGSRSQNGERGGESGMGGGGGGGADIAPVGIIEMTPGETRFISFEDRKRIIRAAVMVMVLGMLLFRPRRKK